MNRKTDLTPYLKAISPWCSVLALAISIAVMIKTTDWSLITWLAVGISAVGLLGNLSEVRKDMSRILEQYLSLNEEQADAVSYGVCCVLVVVFVVVIYRLTITLYPPS